MFWKDTVLTASRYRISEGIRTRLSSTETIITINTVLKQIDLFITKINGLYKDINQDHRSYCTGKNEQRIYYKIKVYEKEFENLLKTFYDKLECLETEDSNFYVNLVEPFLLSLKNSFLNVLPQWNFDNHHLYPLDFKMSALILLILRNRQDNNPFSRMPLYILSLILYFLQTQFSIVSVLQHVQTILKLIESGPTTI